MSTSRAPEVRPSRHLNINYLQKMQKMQMMGQNRAKRQQLTMVYLPWNSYKMLNIISKQSLAKLKVDISNFTYLLICTKPTVSLEILKLQS